MWILGLKGLYLFSRGARLLNRVKRGALFALKEVVIKKQYFIFLGLRVLKWRDKSGSFCHFRFCGRFARNWPFKGSAWQKMAHHLK